MMKMPSPVLHPPTYMKIRTKHKKVHHTREIRITVKRNEHTRKNVKTKTSVKKLKNLIEISVRGVEGGKMASTHFITQSDLL